MTKRDFFVDGSSPNISAEFDDDVSTSMSPARIQVTNIQTDQVIPTSVAYDALLRRATFSINPLELPDGNYHAAIDGIVDYGGNPLGHTETVDFFFLQADANRDRIVDTADFNVLAGHFGLANNSFTQGDFNYDQAVDSTDFSTLVAQFGKRFNEPASMAVTLSPAASIFGTSSVECSNTADILG